MKIPREARKTSRELFGMVMHSGSLDSSAVRAVSEALVREKPRHYFAILKDFSRLVRLELSKHHAVVESATPLDAVEKAAVEKNLLAKFGAGTLVSFLEQPSLIGGVRIRLGSDVWDGSVKARLETLQKAL